MTKHKRPRYTDEFRANAILMLLAQGWPDKKGAQSTVAKHLGVPRPTLVRWAKREQNPPPDEIVHIKRQDMVQRLEYLRHLLLDEAQNAIEDAPLNHLLTGYGILTDKQRLITGQSTENQAVQINMVKVNRD